ncbi:Pirin-related protein [Collimonas arenae]|uniref:Pirin-related protein n=1 Tax=Collimonas arenae TaxID=279058 RepID=A0A0A1F714_9BURK|nr:pirin family protein [Collimonas arenae]AIY39479.1 Pirin-related protein [Collimonas arenae]
MHAIDNKAVALPETATPNARQVIYRTHGRRQEWFTRLASPSGIGEKIKPFVFLDDFDVRSTGKPLSGMHPHSGIATITVVLSGNMEYQDSTGKSGTLSAGSVEWMKAGGGVWHGGGAAEGDHVRGFQLWIALPPEDENGPAHSQYLAPEQVQTHGPARVVLGRYGNAASAIVTRASINYLHVTLKNGQRWRYQPPEGHTVGWVATSVGKLHAAGTVLQKELAVFEESTDALDFYAEGDTEFVLGSAVKHPHDLVLGYYSVHTNGEALERGETEIENIRKQLEANRSV